MITSELFLRALIFSVFEILRIDILPTDSDSSIDSFSFSRLTKRLEYLTNLFSDLQISIKSKKSFSESIFFCKILPTASC